MTKRMAGGERTGKRWLAGFFRCFGGVGMMVAWLHGGGVWAAHGAALPPGGRSILVDPLRQAGTGRQGKKGGVHVVKAKGPGFDRALEIESKIKGKIWQVATSWKLSEPLKKNDVILVHYWARTRWTANESGQGYVETRIMVPRQHKRPQKELRRLEPLLQGLLTSPGKEWREYFIRARAPVDMPVTGVFVQLRAGIQQQRVQFGGIEILDYGTRVPLESLPVTRPTYAGREKDAPWRREAAKRIRSLRTREVRLVVRDREGTPVSAAAIEVELTRHAFQFGAAVTASRLLPAFNPDYEEYRRLLLENFSAASFVNALKWHPWAGDWGASFKPEVTLEALHWVAARKLPFRGHCLVWPRKSSVSRAALRLLEAQPPDPDAIQQAILAHIRDIVPATAFWMEEWDVLNESIPCHDVTDICGDEVMIAWFKETHRLLPKARLALNEYSILSSLVDSEKMDRHEARIRYLLDHGAPLGVLGMQSHMGGTPPGPMRVWEVLERFSRFDLPIRITEFTMRNKDDDLLYDYTRDFLTIVFSHPSVIGFQLWGMDQMVRKQGGWTGIGKAYRDQVLQRWHTRETGKSDAEGHFSCRGFLGTYRVRVRTGDRTVTRTFRLDKGKEPCTWTIDL